MKEITKDNYKDLEYNWNGIIIAYPKIDLYWNAEFYIYKQELDKDNNYVYKCSGYNKEDSPYDGFSGDWSKKDFESCFGNWDRLNYYQFEDLKEFCEWYLHKDDKLHQALEQFVEDTKKFYEKDWIHEKGNTNTPPSTVPKQPSKGNKLMSQDDPILKKYRCEDVYTHDEIRENIGKKKKVTYFEQKYGFNPYEEDTPEELCYWEIYNDENCDNELKRIIEKKWPEIKELAFLDAKIIKNKISCNYTFDEIRDKMEPGWDTRRAQLQDVLKLLELRDMRQNTIDSLMQSTDPSMQEHLVKQLERDEKRIEDFLNEKIL